MIIFQPETETESARIATLGAASFLAYIYLFGEPFGHALGQVLMRRLRNLSNMTVSCYINLTSIFAFTLWAYLSDADLNTFK